MIAGSSNFTHAGLSQNEELNLGQYQPSVVEEVAGWYDEIWDQSEDFDLAALFDARYQEHSPYLIYLRMLYERYGAEIAQEASEFGHGIHLTSFQQDGITRARWILDEYNGVLIADGVGLGKSFIAGELMREARLEKRQKVLLIAPASLRDGMWDSFQRQHAEFHFDCYSYEDIALDEQLGGSRARLENIADYGLVVIDEAHAFRNPDTNRAAALRLLLQGRPPKKLVLLTATPVNNTLWDLYYVLNYFISNDAAFADAGIRSLHDHFKRVSLLNPNDLSPKLLFDVLDAVAVRRTRHFIKKYYANSTIRMDGREVLIQFPDPKVKRVVYDLDEVLPGFFSDFEYLLDPDARDDLTFRIPRSEIGKRLTFARYIPSAYLTTPEPESAQIQVAGLLLSGLLKRFESSSYAFAKTCKRMAASHGAFLDLLGHGQVAKGEAITEWMNTESDDIDDLMDGLEEEMRPVSDFEADELREAVEADREILLDLAAKAETISQETDPKLATLKSELESIAKQAEEDGYGPEDKQNKRKVILFSYFADTVEWISEYLEDQVLEGTDLAAYADRVVTISGSVGSREEAVFGFAPVSSEAPGLAEGRYDLLVATDVLSEGVNLQQARHIINYDLPWNPMRLVQRHGRIDRIGSTHDRVFLRCFFPDQQLDNLLGLEKRLHLKLARAAAAVGVESEVIPGAEAVDRNFTESREEIERLRREEAAIFETGGEATALSGEEYRQDLRKGMENKILEERIKSLAWGSGSGKSVAGATPGYVFCARVGDHPNVLFRFVDNTDPGQPEVMRDTLASLGHASSDESVPRVLSESDYRGAYDAWALARQDVLESWTEATLPRNLLPSIPKAMRDAAKLLRAHPPEGYDHDSVKRLIDGVEGNFGIRIQNLIRKVLSAHEDPRERSLAVALRIDELGLEPAPPPKPLPPITADDIHLVCWMAISNPATVPADASLESAS